jgi:hypothetical protein
MNSISKFVRVGILLACVVILGVYFVISHTGAPDIPEPQPSPTLQVPDISESQPSPNPQSTDIPTAKPYPTPQVLENGWHKFTYPEAGYSIEFPPDTILEESADAILDYNQAIIRFPSSIDYDGAVFKIFTDLNKEKKSLDQYADDEINRIYHGNPPKVDGNIQKNATIIAGHSALSFDSKLNRPIVFIKSKDRYYRLMLVPNMMAGNIPTNESVKLFWKIVDTFTIL